MGAASGVRAASRRLRARAALLMRSARTPISTERRRLNAARRRILPEHLQGPEQILGIAHHSCGATHGVMERCDLACTSCYLGPAANSVKPLPPADVFRQLEALRTFLGPQGKAQITSGEVTLLPRRVLGSYVSYARSIGLDPMVMTHGRRLLADPTYLEELVTDHGLEKLSIHVDSTQRGRTEWRRGVRERELDGLRDRYAQLVRQTRQRTGKRLHAAHTVTVTNDNLDEVAGIVRWILDNTNAFRMVSFQPSARVGRTDARDGGGISLSEVWSRVCEGFGRPLNPRAMVFGHTECHIVAPLVVVKTPGRSWILESARAGKAWDRAFLNRFLRAAGGYSVRGRTASENLVALLSLGLRHPVLVAEGLFYSLYRLAAARRCLAAVLLALGRSERVQIHPLAVVIHKFMAADELGTALGQERLKACTLRVPFDGRMVSMCEMNALELRAPAAQRRSGSPERTRAS